MGPKNNYQESSSLGCPYHKYDNESGKNIRAELIGRWLQGLHASGLGLLSCRLSLTSSAKGLHYAGLRSCYYKVWALKAVGLN